MFHKLVESAHFYKIENGLVYWQTVSGDEATSKAMPIGAFRAYLDQANQLLRDFDALHGVRRLPRRPRHIRLEPLGVDD